MARLLRSELRDGDTLVRWGGEEFAVLAPEHDREGAMKLAERLRAAVASHDFGAAGPLGASVGVVLGTPDIGAAELFRLADGALYRAKEAGPDRIELAAAEFPPRLRVTPKPAG